VNESPKPLSPKQVTVVNLNQVLVGLTLLVGVTGSGKSYAANLRAYGEICQLKNGQLGLFTGNTSDTLYRNVIVELMRMDEGIGYLTYTSNPQRIVTRQGAEIFCVGVNNDGADKRLRGGSVEIWVGDEVNTYPETSFEMADGRRRGLDKDGFFMFKPGLLTANPDEPDHFLRNKIATRSIDRVIEFGFEDNPTIRDAERVKEDYKKIYTGVNYDRLVLGKWAGSATHKIFPEMYEFEKDIVQDVSRPQHISGFTAAIDPGYADRTGFVVGYYDFKMGRYVVENEFLLEHANTRTVANAIIEIKKQYQDLDMWSDTDLKMIADLWSEYRLNISPTRKDNLQGTIGAVRSAMSEGRLIIKPNCINLIRQCKIGLWDRQFKQFERNKEGHLDMISALTYWFRNVDTQSNPYNVIAKIDPFEYTSPRQKRIVSPVISELAKVADDEYDF
jgi:hypothetical protein